jgi:hypothetical protein
MEADIVFTSEYCHPSEPNPGIAVLIKYGFDVEIDSTEYWDAAPDWIGDWTRKVFVRARIAREIDETTSDPQLEFFDWMSSVVEPLGGDLLEAGFADLHARRRQTNAIKGT